MSRVLVITVASQETNEELSRWETLLSQATAQGVNIATDKHALAAFKLSLCEHVCKDLWEKETDPFVSRGQFWLLVHQKAAQIWLGEPYAEILAEKCADYDENGKKIDITWCGEYGERPISQQYAEHWLREKKWVNKKKLDGEILKAMIDDFPRVEVPQDSVAKNQQQLLLQPPPGQAQQQENSPWTVLVNGQQAKEGDATPYWEMSATETAVKEATLEIMTAGEGEMMLRLVNPLPQHAWSMSLGTSWEEMGETLQSASAMLGTFDDWDWAGARTPLFQLQLRLDYVMVDGDGREEWVGELSLRWHTRGADPGDRDFLWGQLYRTVDFFYAYCDTVSLAGEEGTTFPRIDRCASWAVAKFAGVPIPAVFELSDAAEIEREWAFDPDHPQPPPDPRQEEVANMLLDCLDDLIPAAFQGYMANVDVDQKLAKLTEWVVDGGRDPYPVKGPHNRPNRLRWAWLAARDAATAVYQSRYDATRLAMMGESDERSAQLAQHFTKEVERFVDGGTTTAEKDGDWSVVMSLQQRKEVAERWEADFYQRLINSA
ncbi:hypothetical protein PG996_013763 [Apiospora saccharicola]|uniref:PH domain-containing protein n=1 Tax=Apiospora saccharicola TaxID=335842 RepID=A0ABR1TGE1_9PEZI